MEFHVDTVVLGEHRYEVALATCDHINHFAGIFLGDVDGHEFDRFAFDTVDFLDDDLRLSDLKLVAFAPHGLDEDREVQHATTEYGPDVLVVGFLNAQREVAVEFLGETVGDVA